MGQHLAVGRLLTHCHAGQQRRVEPAAMLIGTLQIEVSRHPQLRIGFQHAGVRDPGIEPDIQNVGDLVVLIGLIAEQFGRIQVVPDVGAPLRHPVGHLAHDPRTLWMRLAVLLVDEQRDRHAPGALPRNAPVGAIFDHRADPPFAPAGHPAHGTDGLQRIATQIRLFHPDEPLRGGAEGHRALVPPAVRVAVRIGCVSQQRAALAQHLDDGFVGLPDVQPFEQTSAGNEGAVAGNRIEHLQTVFLTDLKVLLAVTRGGVHRTGTGVQGHVFAQNHRRSAIVEGMAQLQMLQRGTLDRGQWRRIRLAKSGHRALCQPFSQDQSQRLAIRIAGLQHHVVQLRMQRHREIGGQCPRGGGPDRDRVAGAVLWQTQPRSRIGAVGGLKCHIHRRRDLVHVFNFGLGQGRAAVKAPVHRLGTAAQVAVFDDSRQRSEHVGLVAEAAGLIGRIPGAEHAQPLEVAALGLDLLTSVGAAGASELGGIDLDSDLAELLFDLHLDRQTVAVPTRHIGRMEAGQQPRLDHDVLEDLVQRVADVDLAIGVGRTIVKDEFLAAFGMALQLSIKVAGFPLRQHRRFALGQIAAHRKLGFRQRDGVLVILTGGFVAAHSGLLAAARRCLASTASFSICALRASNPSRCHSSRCLATNSSCKRCP